MIDSYIQKVYTLIRNILYINSIQKWGSSYVMWSTWFVDIGYSNVVWWFIY